MRGGEAAGCRWCTYLFSLLYEERLANSSLPHLTWALLLLWSSLTGGTNSSTHLLNGILNLVLTKQREKNAEWHVHQDKLTITSPLPLQIHFAHQFRGETTPDHIKIKNFPPMGFPMLSAAARLTNHV